MTTRTHRTRLAHLAAVWPPQAGTPAWVVAMERQAEVPAEAMALWRYARVRAMRRRLHDHGARPDRGEVDALAERELGDLVALLGAHGDDGGWARWFGAEAGWPALREWAHLNAGQFGYRLEVDEQRRFLRELRSCPTLVGWRARTGWSEAMGEAEEQAFDRRLLEAGR